MTDTTDSTVRLLRLLTLLQQHAVWTGPELAERLDVSVRGVRRDVARLRELGYPVHSERGLGGGYRLAAGKAMPPLVLDDDEAVAVAVSLSLAAGGTVSGVEEDAARALAKLDQVVPARLRERIDAVRAATVRVGAGVTPVDAQVLTTLARACRDGVQVRFGYERAGAGSPHRESSASSAPEPTALAAPESSESSESSGSSGSGAPEPSGLGAPEPSPSSAPESRGSGAPESSAPGAAEPSASIEGRPGATGGAGRVEGPGARGADAVPERRVEPYRLVATARRWYLFSFDLDRDDWRVFRLDRMRDVRATTWRFTAREAPDAVEHVTRGISRSVYRHDVAVRVRAPADQVGDRYGPTIAQLEPEGEGACLMRMGGDQLDVIASYLAFLPWEFEVVGPPELAQAVRELGQRMVRAAEG